jgi:penicillin amidase
MPERNDLRTYSRNERLLRITGLLALASSAFALCSCATGSFISYKLWPDYPRNESRTVKVRGTKRPVRVYFDVAGVPHIRAENETDLMFAVGFIQSRDRFFEMDMIRRIARGRVSELVGEQPLLGSTTVEFDNAMRGWGIDRECRKDAGTIPPEMKPLLEAYVRGVNAALKRKKPLEYRLLRVKPEPWTVADTFAAGRLTAWGVTHNWTQELSRLLLALYVGTDRADELYPSRWWPGSVAVPLADEKKALPPGIVDEVRELFPVRPYEAEAHTTASTPEDVASLNARMGLASNAWVVGGDHTRSGKPLLASDPHLNHFLPSMMMQMHITCPGLDVIGITAPGLPYILIGHNRHVAWGMTSAVADAIDLYAEKVNPKDKDQVLTPSGWRTIRKHEVVIRVRKGDDLLTRSFTHRHSRNGVFINDLYPDRFPSWAPPFAIHWDTQGTAKSIAVLRKGNMARNVTELKQAYSRMANPPSVYMAGDVHGRVALFASGRIPIRRNHRGTFPVPGWLDKYQWKEFAEPDTLPAVVGNAQARLAHGNSLLWHPEKAPFIYHIDSAPSYRTDRIMDLLSGRAKHDVDSFVRMQSDVYLYRAKRVVPEILKDLAGLRSPSALERKALTLLDSWDYHARTDSPGTSIFFMTYREAGIEAIRDEVGDTARRFVLTRRYATHMMDQWFADPKHVVWDHRATTSRESRPPVVRRAFRRAVEKLAERFGKDPRKWRWGRLHRLQMRHVFGGKEALAETVNLKRVELPGGLDSIWKAHFNIGDDEQPFKTIAGPVYRMVVDLADIHNGRWILDTGASGWPKSPHYGDQHKRWVKGETVPMVSHWPTIKANAKGVWTLKPK